MKKATKKTSKKPSAVTHYEMISQIRSEMLQSLRAIANDRTQESHVRIQAASMVLSVTA